MSGIKGWLLILVINLVLIGPIVNISAGINDREVLQQSALPDDFKAYGSVESYSYFAMAACSLVAGIILIARLPKAVLAGRLFLVVWALTAVVRVAIFGKYSAGLPNDVATGMGNELVKDCVRTLIASGVWLLYLWRSKRVKFTYD